MSNSTFFYPQHQAPTAPAHSHWLVTSGVDIPDLHANIAHVRFYAKALEVPLPTDPANKRYIETWVSKEQFQTAMTALLQHFGYEDPGIAVDASFQTGTQRFVLDTKSLNEATGCQWPEWSEWIANLEEEAPGMAQYCQSISYPVFDWKKSIWISGGLVRRNHGYRLRPLPVLQGGTQFDEFVGTLVANPTLLTAADSWVLRISRSTFLEDMIRAGSIDEHGNLLEVDDIIRDRDEVALFLGFQPKSSESIAFDVKQWGFWIFPLMKEAVRLRDSNPEIVQAPFFYSTPVDCDPAVMEAALEMSLKDREQRVMIGSLIGHQSLNSCFASKQYGRQKDSPLDVAIESDIQFRSEHLALGRSVVEEITFATSKFIESHASIEKRPVILPVDHHIFLSTHATRRLTAPSGIATRLPAGTKSSKTPVQDISNEVAQAGEAPISEVVLDLDGDDLSSIYDALTENNGKQERPEDGVMHSSWSSALKEDTRRIRESKAAELYSLFMAIRLIIHRSGSGEDGERMSGRDVKWFGAQTTGRAREKLESEGGVALTDVRSFGRKMILEGYWALGKLPQLYTEALPNKYAKQIQSDMAIWLAYMFITSNPFLYATVIDHMTDSITKAASEGGVGVEGLGVLSSLGMYGNGISIAATIGMRTMNPRDSSTPRQWIRALLYPSAAVNGRPFGSGPRLACLACSGNHVKLQDLDSLQDTSGLAGHLQSVRLRDRLSVSVFATRRGTNSDHTRALGRTSFFDCLVVLIYLVFHPQFVIIFLYHATLIHLQDKAGRGKSSIILTSRGFMPASG